MEADMRIVCPACDQVLGHGDQLAALNLAQGHGPICPATDAEHQQALVDIVFKEMTSEADG